MAKRKKVYMIYVNDKMRDDPRLLFNAAYDHFVKKGMDIALRKKFMSEFMRAHTDALRFDVVHRWTQVRGIESFPFGNKPEQITNGGKKKKEVETSEDQGDTGGVSVDGDSEQGEESGSAFDGSDQGDGEHPE